MRILRTLSPRRLSSRIVGVFLGLLLLVQGASFVALRMGIDTNARVALAHELEVGERIWHSLLDQKARQLVLGTSVLAADYGFRAAVTSGDDDTLLSALENQGGRIGASVSAWVGANGVVRAAHADSGHVADEDNLRAVAAALVGQQKDSAVDLIDGQPHQFVAVPLKAPVLVGWVVMGFPINHMLRDEMRDLSGLQVVLLGYGERDVPRGHGDEVMVTRRIPLTTDSDGASVMLLRSVDEALAPYRQLQWVLAIITAMGVLVFAVGSLFTAGRVTTPLRSLVRASSQLGRGDYTQSLDDVHRRDEIGDLARAFDQMRISLATNEAHIRQLAYRDRLTGLPNRAQFRDELQAAIATAASNASHVSVVMLDLDRFKHVNDVLGYAFGDMLLKAVAERLTCQAVRAGDLVARLSADEFALLLPASSAADALSVAERISGVFELPLTLHEHAVDLSAGFGIACFPDHGDDADILLSRAEMAMYGAKRKTASALVYDPSLDAGSEQSLSLLSELRRALERDELRLFLQPKLALADGRLVGAEALVRWQHPERGQVMPAEFIPFAEHTGFVRQITLWMFEALAARWAGLHALGMQKVSVNLSTRDLMDAELPRRLDEIRGRYAAPASAFCLEITESAIMDEPLRAEATLNALKRAGYRLSIDDFGTGYSSLAYLKSLPVDELKIDKSFVLGMERDVDDAKIVRSTIDLAHNLGLTVVAEGVESAAVWQQLKTLDCDEAQGFLMSRPLPAADMAAFAKRWRERQAEGAASLALH